MAVSEILKIFRLRLTTLTPVSVGEDQAKALSPYTDYVFSDDGGHLLYINPNAVKNAFQKAGGKVDTALMDEYVRAINASIDNNRAEFDLKDFLQNKLGLTLEKPTVRRTVAVKGMTPQLRQVISPAAKSAGDPYLPGSSIKGAIRTAMLYDWLVKTQDGEKVIGFLEKDLKKVAAIRRENPNPRRMPFNVRKDLQALERNFFPEEKLLGSVRWSTGPDARRIRVSDTNVVEGGLAVQALRRIRLTPNPRGGGKSEIPMPREVFFSNSPLECSVSVLTGFDSKALRYWEEKEPADILALLNGFTTAALSNEVYELEHAEGGDFGAEVDQLLDFYQQLYNRAKDGEVFFRLGFGKTIYDNSLALSILNGISDEDNALDAFDAYRHSFWRKNRHARTYPATRTVTHEGLPLGWVKVEVG